MTVRPSDLRVEGAGRYALHCGECVTDYSASPLAYDWMFEQDLIVCEACGSELVLEEKTAVH
jgi:DNA-directed RNA polymerase subunit RPC12/RpoP